MRYNDIDYAYLHNLQGDIVSIVDMDGVSVVQYGYDAWGKLISTEGSMAGTLGKDNPFRYREYVYDEETELHVTATRYYNPELGRFINADVLLGKTEVLLSHNMFAYCINDPISMTDSTGLEPVDAQEVLFCEANILALLYGGDGRIKIPARIRLPNEDVIEGYIRQTPKDYHFDFIPYDKNVYRNAVKKLGAPYKPRHYEPGIPIQIEVDYPDDDRGGKITTWAVVHNKDKETEV